MRPGGMREAFRRPTGYGVLDTTSRFSNPSYILPNQPAHSAGPTQNTGPGFLFCFQKRRGDEDKAKEI